ncbi:MAG: CapA family protein [Gaiellaceae bacterium MAG52_C11]|nr:CapA family protein [Candidatus Gaiellasilicea maunaloa]
MSVKTYDDPRLREQRPVIDRHRAARGARLAGAGFFLALAAVVVLTLASSDSDAGSGAAALPERAASRSVAPAGGAARRSAGVAIAATGDITLGSTPVLPPDGARALFADVERELRGDLVLGNLETALTDSGTSKCGPGSTSCFSFRAPPAYARRLEEAGFTMLNLANNHSFDFGAAGQTETVEALDTARLGHTGRPGEVAYEQGGTVRVAVLGFAPYPWAQSMLDLDAARRLVSRAAATADLVVVTVHAGAEGNAATRVPHGPEHYAGEARGDSRAFAHAVVDAGADLVVGHVPHVLRGIEWYRGRLVAYSLGNFSSYRNLALSGPSGIGGILQVSLGGDGAWRGGRLVPVRLVGDGTPLLDPLGAAVDAVHSLSHADFGPNAVRVADDGALGPPSPG